MLTAFEYEWDDGIDTIYTKSEKPSQEIIEKLIDEWLEKPVRDCEIEDNDEYNAENTFEAIVDNEDLDDDEMVSIKKNRKSVRKDTVVELLMRERVKRDSKITEINQALTSVFPKVAGDKVTFIGSTFLNYGDKKPYLNHCIVLGSCSELPNVNNQEIIR